MSTLTIVRPGLPLPAPRPGELVLPFDEFVNWARRGTVLAHIARHQEGRLLVYRLESSGRPLPLGLALFQQHNRTVWNLIMAGSVLGAIPLVVVFFIFQKQFVRGISLGGSKG